jgi:class 3 adenylate cyclase
MGLPTGTVTMLFSDMEGSTRLLARLGVAPLIRMGLHTGEPTRHEDGYVGMDVHRAARIAASARGGQVVMSEATRQLIAGQVAGVGRGSQDGGDPAGRRGLHFAAQPGG